MKIHFDAFAYFDGTTLAFELMQLTDDLTGQALTDTHVNAPAAKIIIYLREHAIEVYDRRLEHQAKVGKQIPVDLDMDDAKQTKKLLETDEFRKPREEISL